MVTDLSMVFQALWFSTYDVLLRETQDPSLLERFVKASLSLSVSCKTPHLSCPRVPHPGPLHTDGNQVLRSLGIPRDVLDRSVDHSSLGSGINYEELRSSRVVDRHYSFSSSFWDFFYHTTWCPWRPRGSCYDYAIYWYLDWGWDSYSSFHFATLSRKTRKYLPRNDKSKKGSKNSDKESPFLFGLISFPQKHEVVTKGWRNIGGSRDVQTFSTSYLVNFFRSSDRTTSIPFHLLPHEVTTRVFTWKIFRQ